MLLKPKRTKYKGNNKAQKGRISYKYKLNKKIKDLYCDINKKLQLNSEGPFYYYIVALEPNRITANNIYAVELALKRKIRLLGLGDTLSIHSRAIFPHIPVTQKPIEVRMGKGKGKIEYWMTRVTRGSLLWELKKDDKKEVTESAIYQLWNLVDSKLPIKTILIKSNIKQ